MKLLLVINPVSGGKSKDKFLDDCKELADKYGIDLRIFKTTGKNDKEELMEVYFHWQPEKVAACGGDGTVLLVASTLQDFEIPFGIVPLGSANGMAAELSVNSNPNEALKDILISGKNTPLDLIKVNEEYYSIHMGDVGVNAWLVENYSKEDSRGWLSYAKHFLDAVSNAELIEFEMKIDSETVNDKGYMIALANSRKYGTGAILNPKGNPHDGKFEIVVIKSTDLTEVINLGRTVITPDAVKLIEDKMDIYQTEEVEIKLSKPYTLQLDGEVIGKMDEIKAKIIPAAVQMITTDENPFLK